MDRQTLDMEGARRGEISAASLQMGDDTIAIQRIATMSVESMEFYPWDTPANRRVQSLYASFFVLNLFFGLMGLAWGLLLPDQSASPIALIVGGVLTFLALLLGVRAVMVALRLKKRQSYYRLVIGASDGRQIPLVDDNRDVLMRIRDVVRQKMDTGDRDVRGEFDLDLDLVNLKMPTEAQLRPVPVSADAEDSLLPEQGISDAGRVTEAEVLFDEELDKVKTAS